MDALTMYSQSRLRYPSQFIFFKKCMQKVLHMPVKPMSGGGNKGLALCETSEIKNTLQYPC